MMKNKMARLCLIVSLLLPISAHAEWIIDIFNQLVKIYGLNLNMNDNQQAELDEMSKLRDLNQSQLDQMIKLTNGLTGTRQFGNPYYDANRFDWGQGSGDWQSLLSLVNNGGSNTDLGAIMRLLSNEFPMKDSLDSPNDIENEYYRRHAQTTLANRAASQLAYNQLNAEAQTLQRLHQMIDTTPDAKSAADLNNRLLAENTMVNIQQAKLLAMLLQQTTIDSQQRANRAKASAEFFDIR